MIESIQAHNGVPNECYNKCQIKSLWTCFISYAKRTLGIPLQLHTATSSQAVALSWPTVANVVGPWPPQAGWVSPYLTGEAPPVAIVESEHYRWLARNLACTVCCNRAVLYCALCCDYAVTVLYTVL